MKIFENIPSPQGPGQTGAPPVPADPAEPGQDDLQPQHRLPAGEEAERGGRLGVPLRSGQPADSVQPQGEDQPSTSEI